MTKIPSSSVERIICADHPIRELDRDHFHHTLTIVITERSVVFATKHGLALLSDQKGRTWARPTVLLDYRSMSAYNAPRDSGIDRSTNTVRHSKELALTEREFELLLEGARRIGDYRARQAETIILLAGRLGMRSGEIVHMKESWVDWRRRLISVPRHEPCHKGRDGGPCGSCRQSARQRAKHNDGLTMDEALRYSWSSKTDAAARDIPFDFDPRVELGIERFFEEWSEYPHSQTSINRRVALAADRAEELDVAEVTPHGLRATAASYHAGRGLDSLTLQSLLGWAQLSTARMYVTQSTENTRRALHSAHSR